MLASVAYAAGGFVASPWPVVLATVASLAILRSHGIVTKRTLGWAILVLGVSSVRAELALGDASSRYERARTATTPPTRCELTGEVVMSPTVRGGADRVVLEIASGACKDRLLTAGDRVAAMGAAPGLRRGDVVRATVELAPVQLFANDEVSNRLAGVERDHVAATGKLRAVEVVSRGFGIESLVDDARARVRERIDATYHPDAAPLARALVLGETDLDPSVDEAFRETGLSHLLAVSGTHLVVAVLSLAAALRAILLRVPLVSARFSVDRISSALAIPLAWAYSDFAGGSGSVLRAAAMLTVALGARTLGRAPCASRSVGLAIATGVVLDPLALLDVSFTLSTAATVGLLVLSRPLGRALGSEAPEGAGLLRRAWSKLAEAIGATLAATLACAPAILTLSPRLPLVGLAANLVAAPLGELFALPICLAHGVLSAFPPVELGAARVGSGALLGVLGIARVANAIPLRLAVPTPTGGEIGVLALGAIVIATRSSWRSRAMAMALVAASIGALEIGTRYEAQPVGKLRVSALDIGQGDSLLVDLPSGGAMLIDAGGIPASALDTGKRVVLPVLRARRRSRLDVVVLSHPHPDHFGGLTSTLQETEVGEIWDTGEAERGDGGYAARKILDAARARGTPILRPADLCGAPRDVGGATVRVLAPCPDLQEGWSTNDGSLVLKITFGHRSALFVGDAEHAAEERLLATEYDNLPADLLKVGHHGSKTSSSPTFIARVAPRWAVISCGVRNRFGHPSRSTLDTLAEEGTVVRRTDLGGEWRWWTDGEEVWTSR